MRTVRLTKESTKDILENLLKRSPNNYGKFEAAVADILANVKEKGDEAFLWWGCLLFPLALAFGRKDIFLETAQSNSSLSQEDKTFLEGFFGEIR